MSHLYGVFPGGFINERETPELFEASIKSYDYRLSNDGGYTGWSRSWCANLDARFGRGDSAFEQVKELIREFSSDSLLDLHPPKIFQIDGNFGGISGILEMLVRVSGERVKLLPALPSELKNGSIRGVRLPGGAVCDLVWRDGKLADCRITMGVSGKLILEGNIQVQGGTVVPMEDCVEISASAGTVLTITE
jgi:alpha-L-fucosidase 2